jgi:glycosyltransferase involved in cell wall biosynthesis
LRILVDASAAFNQGAGIGRASRSILSEARRHLPDAEFVLWYAPERDGTAQFARELLERVPGPREVIRARFSRRRADQLLFRARLPLPFQALAGRGDIAYSPDFTSPHAWGIPNLVTIHDLAFMVRPETAPEPLRRYLNAVVPAQIDRAARVVAVSRTTKDDLVDRLGVEPDKVVVIPNGVEASFFDAAPLDDRHRVALGLPDEYLLTVGTIEPRKNHLNLFAALERMPNSSTLPLVVAGRVGWSADPILAASAPLQVRNRVILLDYVPEALLPGLIAGAEAMVYPSWYEGFGLPVLEAMAAGTPIVASDVPAHREVAGDLAEFCDPGDPSSIAAAIEAVQRSDAANSERRSARQARAREYTWSASGKKLTTLMTELTASKTTVRAWKNASPP